MSESYQEAIQRKRAELRDAEREFRWKLAKAPLVFGGMAYAMYRILMRSGWEQANAIIGGLLFALLPIVIVLGLWYRLSRRP